LSTCVTISISVRILICGVSKLKSRINHVNNPMFWDTVLRRLLEVNQNFGGTYYLHAQGGRVSKQETSMKQVASK
jgi:hypothetical protein